MRILVLMAIRTKLAYCFYHQDKLMLEAVGSSKKHRSVSARLHGRTYQKTAVLIHSQTLVFLTETTVILGLIKNVLLKN